MNRKCGYFAGKYLKHLLPAAAAVLMLLFTSKTVYASDLRINTTSFPDKNFRNFVSANLDTDQNGYLSDSERAVVRELSVSCCEIGSLKGIENFGNLVYLDCFNNQIEKLDTSANTKLETLICSDNRLSKLDLRKNKKLAVLLCDGNKLTSLNTDGCSVLNQLLCYGNRLSKLNVSGNPALIWLWCDDNRLSSLDVSANVNLENLDCRGNKLKKLDVSKNTRLSWLGCDDNRLTKLNLSKNTLLAGVDCSGNALKTLDLSKNKRLEEARVSPQLIPVAASVSGKSYVVNMKTAFGDGLSRMKISIKKDYGSYSSSKKKLKCLKTQIETAVCQYDTKSVNGDKMTLTLVPVAVTKQPAAASAEKGKKAKFSVTAVGPDLTYQWQYQKPGSSSWTNLKSKSAKTATLSIEATVERYKYSYRCVVKSGGIERNSKAAVLYTFAIKKQPEAKSASSGKTVKFTVKAIGKGLKYRWQYQKPGSKKWVSMKSSSAKKATLSVKADAAKNGYKYRCVVTNSKGKKLTSSSAKLKVK